MDAFVQSTDKNFMVPVGGTIIAGFDKAFISRVSQCYPGRASSSPIIDLFITLLSLGSTKYVALVKERKQLHNELKDGLSQLALGFGQRLLVTPGNSISVGACQSLNILSKPFKITNLFVSTGISLPEVADPKLVTQLGSQLFLRCVSGTRVVSSREVKNISGHSFTGWGSHHDAYPTAYLTAAATVGMTRVDVQQFLSRLAKVMENWAGQTTMSRSLLSASQPVNGHHSESEQDEEDNEH